MTDGSPMSACAGCGAPLPASRRGRPRKWCSDRCRKAQYSRPCVDCGKLLGGSDGTGPNAPTRCSGCANRVTTDALRVWSREAIIAAIRAWAQTYGEPPSASDWSPSQCRYLNDEPRALRAEATRGDRATVRAVYREFGSWNAAIEAAGYTARSSHGGDGNERRRRSVKAIA